MPFVAQIVKAKRFRPRWQDVRPTSRGLRNLYDVASKNVLRFSRAFQSLSAKIFDNPEDLKRVEDAVRDGRVEDAIRALPFYNENDESSVADWEKFAGKIEAAYIDVMQEGGGDALREVGIKHRFRVDKQDRLIPVLPPNPFSIRWIKSQSARLVKEVNSSVQELLRNIILDGYTNAERVEDIMGKITRSGRLGLLTREHKWVENVAKRMRTAGASEEKIQRATEKKAKKFASLRAERIARTETITAQAQGRQDAWNQAKDEGLLPLDIEREWVAAGTSVRTCKICMGLNGQKVGLNEPFQSKFVGSVMNPPSHPNCRCVTILNI